MTEAASTAITRTWLAVVSSTPCGSTAMTMRGDVQVMTRGDPGHHTVDTL